MDRSTELNETKEKKVKKRIYILDRWFYLNKDLEDKTVYYSKRSRDGSQVGIEIDKDGNSAAVLYFDKDINKKDVIAILFIEDLKTDEVKFHYQDQEPQLININDNTYVNLLVELFSKGTERIVNKKIVKITEKKKLNKKKKMVYYPPEGFELNTEISLNSINIESKTLGYSIELIDYIKSRREILKIEDEDELEIPEHINVERVKNLHVPSELYIYDRKYEFINRDDTTLYYQNTQGGIRNLEIKIDPNNIFTGLILKIKNEQRQKYIFQATKNDLNGITVKFKNRRNATIRLVRNSEHKDCDDAVFSSETTYDINDKEVSNKLEIRADSNEYELTHHPHFTNTYVDEEGNTYRVLGQEFGYLTGLSDFSTGIFKTIEKKLIG